MSAMESSGFCSRTFKSLHWLDLINSIYPPYDFSIADCMITNFHTPAKSTLLMMISAFCGHDLIDESLRRNRSRKISFYSYGDAMLII